MKRFLDILAGVILGITGIAVLIVVAALITATWPDSLVVVSIFMFFVTLVWAGVRLSGGKG
jgi:hypothetical protein